MMGNRLDKQKKTWGLSNNSGLTVLELLFSIAILGIIMISLQQVMGTALSAYEQTTNKQELLAQARYAMDRMVMFAQEAEDIDIPSAEQLKVTERLLDTYDNSDQTYMPGGDGYLDADNDYDGLINEGGADPKEYITFRLNNGALEEEMPNYSTSSTIDTLPWQELCDHLSGVTYTLLGTNLVEIELSLNDGNSQVTLKTRVKAMYVN